MTWTYSVKRMKLMNLLFYSLVKMKMEISDLPL